MPAPYSVDLRKRIVEFYNNEGTLSETARRFKVSVKSVWNLVSRFRKENTVEPRHKAGGRHRSVNPAGEIILKELSAQEPDAVLDELCEKFREKTGKTVSVPTIHRCLKRLNITRRKNFLRSGKIQ